MTDAMGDLGESPSVNTMEKLEGLMTDLQVPPTEQNQGLVAFVLEEIALNDEDPAHRLEEISHELMSIPDIRKRLYLLAQIAHQYRANKVRRDGVENGEEFIRRGEENLVIIEQLVGSETFPADDFYGVPYAYLPQWFIDYKFLESQRG